MRCVPETPPIILPGAPPLGGPTVCTGGCVPPSDSAGDCGGCGGGGGGGGGGPPPESSCGTDCPSCGGGGGGGNGGGCDGPPPITPTPYSLNRQFAVLPDGFCPPGSHPQYVPTL